MTSRFEFIMSPAGVLNAVRSHRSIRTGEPSKGDAEPTRPIPSGFIDVPINLVPQAIIDLISDLESVVDSLDRVA